MAAPLVLAPVDVGPVRWDFSRTYIFGVVNVTPDSFSDGGQAFGEARAVASAEALAAAGADALDIGGESTRPGSKPVSTDEELRRVIPVIAALKRNGCKVPISVDTYKSEVAKQAVLSGASLINDVSGGRLDPRMASVVAETGASFIVGHLRGKPSTMQDNIAFEDVVAEVTSELRGIIRKLVFEGVKREQIWVDPGIGFGKTAEQCLALLRACGDMRADLGYPMMIGPSKKSFIGAVTGAPVDQRVLGTAVACAAVIRAGVDALRLHDVGDFKDAVKLADAIARAPSAFPRKL